MNKKEVLFLSIGVFLTVLAWLIADLYHASTKEKIKSKVEFPNIATYEINTNILKILQNKKQ